MGEVKDWGEAIIGYDIYGNKLSWGERGISAGSGLLPFADGGSVRRGAKALLGGGVMFLQRVWPESLWQDLLLLTRPIQYLPMLQATDQYTTSQRTRTQFQISEVDLGFLDLNRYPKRLA